MLVFRENKENDMSKRKNQYEPGLFLSIFLS